MGTGATRLGVDIGAAHTAGIIRLGDGRRTPLTPDGAPSMPGGVFIDPDTGQLIAGAAALAAAVTRPDCYLVDVKGHIAEPTVRVAGRSVEPVELLAALLRHLAAEASRAVGQPPDAVTITVPAGWGPRRRTLVRDAAARAGLPEPDLLAEPIAVAEHLAAATGGRPPPGACVLVCDAGATALRLTVLQLQPGDTTMLATLALPESGGDTIDTALVRHATTALTAADPAAGRRLQQPSALEDLRDQRALLDAARHAKHTLSHMARTVIALPPPHLPAVIDRADLDTVTAPIRDRLPAAVKEVLEAADVIPTHLAAVILTGGAAALPGLADALAAPVGMPPLIPARPDLAAADGAVAHAAPMRAPSAADITLPRVRLRIRHLTAPLALGAASLALLTQMLTTAEVRTDYVRTTSVRADTELIAAAGLLAMLAAYAVAYLAPTTWLTGTTGEATPTTGTLIRRAFTLAAGLGLAVAGLYGLFAGTYYGLADPHYLRLAILSATPTAIAALAIAAVGPRIAADQVPTWLTAIRLPVTGILLAAGGIVLMHYANTVSPSNVPIDTSVIGMLGGATVGVAIALTVTRQRLIRAVTATVLGIGAAASTSLGTTPIITTAYIYAAAWWALTATIHTLHHVAPHLRPRWRQLLQWGSNQDD